MAASLIALPFRPTINLRGGLESGAKLFVYASGTTTPVSVYSDAALSTQLSNPVIADALGVFPDVYFDDSANVRVIIQQANGTVLSDTDPYVSDPASAEASADAAAQSAAYASGFEAPEYASQAAGEAALTTAGLIFRVPASVGPGGTFDFYRIVSPGVSEEVAGLAVNLHESFEVTVGTGGDFSTLNAAIQWASQLGRPVFSDNSVVATITLLSGFTMAEQVLVDGIDLGFVKIVSEDATVPVDSAGITDILLEGDDTRPLMAGVNGATLPRIGCLFDYSGAANDYDGFGLSGGSKIFFEPSPDGGSVVRTSGCKNARRGLVLLGGSEAYCHIPGLTQGGAGNAAGPDFSGCSNRAFQAQHGCHSSLPRSDFSNCSGDYSVYVIWGGDHDLYQSDASGNTSGTGFHARDGAKLNARDTNASNCNRGYHALHGGEINARFNDLTWSGGATGGASNCSDYGALANDGGKVWAESLPVSGSRIGFHASNGSAITATNAVATGCTEIAVSAVGNSSIAADGINASGCTGSAAVFCQSSSSVSVDSANLSGSAGRGIDCRETGRVQARDADISEADGTAVYALRSGAVNCRNADLSGAGDHAVEAVERADVNAQSCDGSGSTNTAFEVIRGSTINAGSATGSLSQTANTVTAAGIIFQ